MTNSLDSFPMIMHYYYLLHCGLNDKLAIKSYSLVHLYLTSQKKKINGLTSLHWGMALLNFRLNGVQNPSPQLSILSNDPKVLTNIYNNVNTFYHYGTACSQLNA